MPGKPRTIDLIWPAGGEFAATAYQRLPPYTCARALNVRTQDTIEQRDRGGQRPGLTKAFTTELGSGSPVRLIAQCRDSAAGTIGIFDDFDYLSFPSNWTQASWLSDPPTFDGDGYAKSASGYRGLVRELQSDLDDSSGYSIAILLSPDSSLPTRSPVDTDAGYPYAFIYLRMDDTTPDAEEDGVVVRMESSFASSQHRIHTYIDVYESGSVSETFDLGIADGTDGGQPVVASVSVSGDDVTVLIGNDNLGTTDISAYAAAGTGFGFGVGASPSCPVGRIGWFAANYLPESGAAPVRNWTLASAGGTLYREDASGTGMTAVTGDSSLNSAKPLDAVEHLGSLYIADHSETYNVYLIDATVTGDQLDSASVSDWTTVANSDDDLVEIIAGSAPGVYAMSSVASGAVTLSSSPGNDTDVTVRIVRAPKVWDSGTNTISIWNATSGTMPLECKHACRFMGGIVLAGQREYPHIAYHSASGDPLDWDTGATSPTGAYATTLAETDVIGQPIVALIPYRDDFLIYGCESQIWMQRGSLRLGGVISNVSRNVGVLSNTAWCWTPGGELIFMSRGDGLYRLIPGGIPEPVSRERLPKELIGIDPDTTSVSLAWDFRDRGVRVMVTSEGGVRDYWFIHWKYGAFWRERYPVNAQCTKAMDTAIINKQPEILIGCYDGYIRKPDPDSVSDDGNVIVSDISLGPFRLGRSDFDGGELSAVVATLGYNSAEVQWEAIVGETAQEVSSAIGSDYLRLDEDGYTRYTEDGLPRTTESSPGGTWAAGRNYPDFVNLRGGAAAINIYNSNAAAWAIEGITARILDGGIGKL